MNFTAEGFSLVWLVTGMVFFAVSILWGLLKAPWSKLISDSESQHVFVGVVMILILAWLGEASIKPGMGYHVLLLTTVTLMFGPQFAVLAGTLALVAVAVMTEGDWWALGLSGSVVVILPIMLVWALTLLSYKYLEKGFFVFVLFNGFFVAALSTIVVLFTSAAVMYYSGVYDFESLNYNFFPYIPMMVFPEAFMNGMLVITLVMMKPEWVACFDDDIYLKGK